MKNLILISACIVYGFSAQAQMADTLGALGLQGELTNQGYNAVNKGTNALNRLLLQQDLAALAADIQMTYMGNYSGLSKSGVLSEGIHGVNWDVAEDKDGGFVIILNGIDGAACFTCKSANFGTKKVDINGSGECKADSNIVKMYFD